MGGKNLDRLNQLYSGTVAVMVVVVNGWNVFGKKTIRGRSTCLSYMH